MWLINEGIELVNRGDFVTDAQSAVQATRNEWQDSIQQGLLSSMLTLSWQIGWALMPTISGMIQERVGFTPIFIATAVLYAVSTLLIWAFFSKLDRAPQENAMQVTSEG